MAKEAIAYNHYVFTQSHIMGLTRTGYEVWSALTKRKQFYEKIVSQV